MDAAILSALGAVVYKACRLPGPGKVSVTFAPSGKVSKAQVTAGAFPQAVVTCIERAFRAAKIAPFPGPDPLTFAWQVEP